MPDNTRAVEPWLDVLDETRLGELKALVFDHAKGQDVARLLTLLLLCGLRDWKPGNVAAFVKGLPVGEMRETHQILQDRGISPVWWPKKAR